MKVWFAGGGTGGHLYPALAIARALISLRPDVQPLFVGARRGIEREVLPETEFAHLLLELHPLYRSAPWRNWRTVTRAFSAWRTLSHTAAVSPPAAVVATGGYASGLALLYATVQRIPMVLQEQNSVPGLTTRFFSRYARQIHLGFPEAAAALPARARAAVRDSGNPIAPPAPVDAAARTRTRQDWGLDPGRPVLLVFGGSQGARAVNNAVAAMVRTGVPGAFQLLWVTGRGEHAQYASLASAAVRIEPFISGMARVYPAVDVALARAGAMSTAELCAWGIPSILVPLPTAAADHQTTNAVALARAGAAIMVPQRELSADTLRTAVAGLVADPERLARMRSAALARARPQAAATIARDVASLL